MAEQAFLAKHYDENAKKPDRDPRGAFRNPSESATAGIVGPMGSSSFNLPTVERALSEMEAGIDGTSGLNASVNGDAGRRLSRGATGTRPSSGLSGLPGTRRAISPTLGASTTTAAGGTNHEVLQHFFQSLLSAKERPEHSAAASRTAAELLPKTNKTPGSADDGS